MPNQPAFSGPAAPGGGRRTSWRAAAGRPAGNWRLRRLGLVIGLVTSAVIAVGVVASLLLAPFYAWRSGLVVLAVDAYSVGTVEPLPFAAEDAAGLRAALAGGVAAGEVLEPVDLADLTAADSLRSGVGPRCRKLPLRRKDVLIAYLRGQCLVPPNSSEATASNPYAGRPCLLAADCQIAGSSPKEIVPIRDVVEAIGSASPLTTLVALDLGSIGWEPRIGVLASLVGRQLDAEFARPQQEASFSNWVIGSHDLFESSLAHWPSRRTLFARAVELALAGTADQQPWGNGNAVIELDELARFVTAQTAAWARQLSAGRLHQRPVIWKLGVGRVAVTDIPPGIALSRVVAATDEPAATDPPADEDPDQPPSSPAAKTGQAAFRSGRPRLPPPPAALLLAGLLAADDGPAFPQAAQPAAKPTPAPAAKQADPPSPGSPQSAAAAVPPPRQPTADGRQPAAESAWELLDRIGARRQNQPRSPPGLADQPPVPLDYAPHVWRAIRGRVASLAVRTAASDQPAADQTAAVLRGLRALTKDDPQQQRAALPGMLERLATSRRAADRGGFFRSWAAAAGPLRRALVVRNDAVDSLLGVIGLVGTLSGGSGMPAIDPVVMTDSIDQLRALSARIERVPLRNGASSPGRIDPLETATDALAVQMAMLQEITGRFVAAQVRRVEQGGLVFSTDAVTAALALPGGGSGGRQSLLEAIAATNTQTDEPPQPLLATATSLPLPADAWPVGGEELANIGQQAEILLDLLDAAGLLASSNVPPPEPLADVVEAWQRARKAIEPLTDAVVSDTEAVAALLRAGGAIAETFAETAAAADRLADLSNQTRADDRIMAVYRILDQRDLEAVASPATLGFIRRQAVTPAGVALVTETNQLPAVGQPLPVRLVPGGSEPPPAGANIRLVYDPAVLAVRVAGGERLDADRQVPCRGLPFAEDGLPLEVVAQRETARGTADSTVITVTLEVGKTRELSTLRLALPADRELGLEVRRRPTADGRQAWLRPAATEIVDKPGPPTATTVLPLRHLPGRTTSWEAAVVNPADIAREFAIEVYSVPSSPEAGQRTAAWAEARRWLLEGGDNPGLVSLGELKKLNVAAGGRAAVSLPPPPAPEQLPAPTGSEPPAPPPRPAPVGPDLALLIREQTAGEPARRWLHRLPLLVEHPRAWLEATATWQRRDRSIAISIEPAAAADLAALEVRCELTPLGAAPVAGRQPVSIRRRAVSLGGGRSAGSLLATYNGSDKAGTAWLSVAVDGYPRALVFAVECSAASDGRPQQPLADWRSVSFREPAERKSRWQAPRDTVPLVLEVDAPADAVSPLPPDAAEAGEQPLVALDLREIGGAAMAAEPTRIWSAVTDRQFRYRPTKPEPGAFLAIETTVSDWNLEPPSGGFIDVNVEAEASLRLPGGQAPLSDRRLLVFDGRAPRIELPPQVNAVVGRRLAIPIRVLDDPREGFGAAEGVEIPGVTGVRRVDWAVDRKGDGKPEAWQPAVGLGGGRYELRVDTKQLPPGRRTPLLVRAIDRVDNADAPARLWLDTAAMEAKSQISGRVTLDGRGERGLTIRLDGPTPAGPVRSGKDGRFEFKQLEPGSYTLRAEGAVRNQLYRAEPQPVAVEPPPAPAPRVTLELKPR